MKKRFLVMVFILFSYNSFCQFHIDLGGGISERKDIYGKGQVTHQVFPKIEIVAGYEVKSFIIQAEMKPSISKNSSAFSYFGAAAGFKIRYLIFEGGIYRSIISEDDLLLNNWKIGPSLEYFGRLMQRGGIYGKVMYINNSLIFTTGFRINIQ
jgi:hypothetical protein